MAPQVLPAAADVACASCGAAFASRNALFKHLRAAHSLPPNPVGELAVDEDEASDELEQNLIELQVRCAGG